MKDGSLERLNHVGQEIYQGTQKLASKGQVVTQW